MSYLPGQPADAQPGAPGFDTDSPVSPETAAALFQDGFQFCVRYITLGDGEASGDLSAQEAQEILGAGLALMPVQHVRYPGWVPDATLGTQDGQQARANAYRVGFPALVNVWLDLEGVDLNTSAQQIIDYCNAWYDAVNAWGYVPGIYVGVNCGLTSNQLYYDLKFEHYWKSASNAPTPAVRGYQMIQSDPNSTYRGLTADRDTTQTDDLGGKVIWLSPNS